MRQIILISLLVSQVMATSKASGYDAFGRKVDAFSTSLQINNLTESVKKEFFSSEDSLKDRLNTINERLNKWLLNWQSGHIMLLKNIDSNSLLKTYANIDEFALKQYVEFIAIKEDAHTVLLEINQKLDEIEQQKKLDYEFPGFQFDYQNLEEHISGISKSLSTIQQSTKSTIETLTALQEPIVRVFKEKARQAFINNNITEITEAIANIDRLFLKYEIVGKYIVQIEIAHSNFNQAYFSLDYFAAKRHLNELELSYSELVKSMNNVGLPASMFQKESQQFSAVIETAKRNLKILIQAYGGRVNDLVYESTKIKNDTVSEYCRTLNQGRYNCDIFKWLSRIGQPEIDSMNMEELAHFDEAWQAVLKK
ncbi:MAG: hypothetical protein ACOH5I_03260 [Oligoflexus sp.]